MNIYKLSFIWLISLIIPISILVLFKVNIYTLLAYFAMTALVFLVGIRAFKALIIRDFSDRLHLKVNAINHNINEALVVAKSNGVPVSLSDSLSIKENLYAIESSVRTRRAKIATHHRKLRPLLSTTLQDYQSLAESLGVHMRICFDADEHIRILKVDPSLLNKVLSIVLSNAISVTPQGRKIIVSTELSEDHYSIMVKDFAGGIDSDVLSKVNKYKTKTFGRRVDVHNRIHYGLGLITLKGLLQGSNISVKSNADGIENHVAIKISRNVASIGLEQNTHSLEAVM